MGLALEVGMLAFLLVNDDEGATWFERDIKKLNALLAKTHLQPHIEPRTLDTALKFSCSMWGYDGLHALRRVAAHIAPKRTLLGERAGKLPPPLPSDQAAEDAVLQRFYNNAEGRISSPFRHLIHHSDAEGFYVPQNFSAVLSADEITGGYVGSTHQLFAECSILAKALGIPKDLAPESDEVIKSIEHKDARAKGWKAYPVETYSCLQLLLACQASMKSGALLVFC